MAPASNPLIELAYMGAHQIFQMALSAEEAGQLSGLQCSLVDAPGKWGRWLPQFLHMPVARPTGSSKLPPSKIHEIPGPLLRSRLASRFSSRPRPDPLPYCKAFEKAAAKRLRKLHHRPLIAVGAETCALGFFQEARRLDMHCMLDCHGIPNRFLDESLLKASDFFGLPTPPASNSTAMDEHKAAERELSDILVCCSELQRDVWVSLGVPASKLRVVPLWVDSEFWHPAPDSRAQRKPLQIVAVGAGTLAKGLPYLVEAVAMLYPEVQLSVVGGISTELRQWLANQFVPVRVLRHMSKLELRNFLQSQDILIMASLGDSFGFVAIEAMACGLPVIVTDHCGVPVPASEWRVPAHSAEMLASRISHYLKRPEELLQDGSIARSFATQFTPERYRREIRQIYQECLS